MTDKLKSRARQLSEDQDHPFCTNLLHCCTRNVWIYVQKTLKNPLKTLKNNFKNFTFLVITTPYNRQSTLYYYYV